MADLMPSPPLPSLAPHDIAWDGSFDGIDSDPLPYVPDVDFGDPTMAVTTAGTATAGGCNNDCLKACIVAASKPSISLPSLIPDGITLDKKRLAHAPPSSPVRADDASVANLFCGLQGVSQNKRLSLPRVKLGRTPARNKRGRTMRQASSVKAQGAIQEMLAALHIDDLVDRGAKLTDLHLPIVTPNCNVAGVGDHKDDTSDNEDYHPDTTGHVPPPLHACLNKRRSSPGLY
jgi:hypothetical protein